MLLHKLLGHFLFWHEFAEKDIRKGEASLGIYHLEREIHEN